MSAVKQIASFFNTLQELHVFFGHSIKRWDFLTSLTCESEVTLKKIESNKMGWSPGISYGSETSICGLDESINWDHSAE